MNGIIDFHTHAFPDELAGHALKTLQEMAAIDQPRPSHDGTTGGLLLSMDSAGIERSVICSVATAPKQFSSILEWSLAISSRRLVPFASVHPQDEEVESRVMRVKEAGIRGLKLHPHHQGIDAGDEAMFRLCESVRRSGLILVIHCGLDFAFDEEDHRAHPLKIRALHDAFPEIPLVATHMGGWRQWEASLDELAGTDVYFETSFSVGVAPDALMLEFFKKHSREKILFGSDSPWMAQCAGLESLERILMGRPELLKGVLVENAMRLLERGTRSRF